MRDLRRLIRNLILEAFTQADVEAQMATDDRDYGVGKFGANAKDIFRQQREANPSIDEFLNSVITIHWKRVQYTEEFVPELDYELLREPLQNTNTNDELSCSPYIPYDNGTPMALEHRGWHDGDKLGIEVKGWISWLEHGDAQTGHGGQRKDDSQSGANKQPRRTMMGRDPGKGNSMADVIQSEVDFFKRKGKLSSYGDGEALVDNWDVVKVWYIDELDEMAACQASMMLSKRFNKKIPYQQAQGEEQFGLEDFSGSIEDPTWTP